MNKDFSKLINSIKFQMMSKRDILDNLEFYADENIKTISRKDYNNTFILYSFNDKCFKSEVIKRLSQKTILKALAN